jgi:hypothetical protein
VLSPSIAFSRGSLKIVGASISAATGDYFDDVAIDVVWSVDHQLV